VSGNLDHVPGSPPSLSERAFGHPREFGWGLVLALLFLAGGLAALLVACGMSIGTAIR
jgi:hypothetical protein